MIRGAVNPRGEAALNLRVRGPNAAELDIDVVIDTGFTASRTLPPAVIVALSLLWDSETEVLLGDGSTRRIDLYAAEIEWDGAWRTVLVTEVDTNPLLGTRLLAGHEVFIEFVPGGVVDITRLP